MSRKISDRRGQNRHNKQWIDEQKRRRENLVNIHYSEFKTTPKKHEHLFLTKGQPFLNHNALRS